MNRDPKAWAELGKAIRKDRERQSLTREDLADRVKARGGAITPRSIASLEYGTVPKKRPKPPTLAPTVAALGWPLGAEDRILAGEAPAAVLASSRPAPKVDEARTAREAAFELLPGVYAFSRAAAAAGADPQLRDRFDELAQRIIESVPTRSGGDGVPYRLAAYRPHDEEAAVPLDDAQRILSALDDDEA